jgi:hypothetical protein
MSELTPDERREIRQALDGAMLNVAIHAASLHVGRRIHVRLGQGRDYQVKYAGTNWSMLTTPSLPLVVRFLDNLGIPAQGASLDVAA